MKRIRTGADSVPLQTEGEKYARRVVNCTSRNVLHALYKRERGGFHFSSRAKNISCTRYFKYFTCPRTSTFAMNAPLFSCSFNKVKSYGHFLAAADEDGNISVFDTRTAKSDQPNPYSTWVGHNNAIFDLAWSDQESKLATASGDQTVRIWDIETGSSLTFRGHCCSVKSVSFKLNDPHVFASAGRDGNICLWDTRNSGHSEVMGQVYYKPSRTISNAHSAGVTQKKRGRSRLSSTTIVDNQQSVTAVTFLHNNNVLASCGAVDGFIKLWDTRRPYSSHDQNPIPICTLPYIGKQMNRGFSSLSVNSTGSKLLASCTDETIYMYDVLNGSRENVKSFRGHKTGASFYVKSTFSPDDKYIASGSSTQALYIWEVDSSSSLPFCTMEGHTEEVTSVSWCPGDIGKIASCSDDSTLNIWTMDKGYIKTDHDRYRINILDNTPVATTVEKENEIPSNGNFKIKRAKQDGFTKQANINLTSVLWNQSYQSLINTPRKNAVRNYINGDLRKYLPLSTSSLSQKRNNKGSTSTTTTTTTSNISSTHAVTKPPTPSPTHLSFNPSSPCSSPTTILTPIGNHIKLDTIWNRLREKKKIENESPTSTPPTTLVTTPKSNHNSKRNTVMNNSENEKETATPLKVGFPRPSLSPNLSPNPSPVSEQNVRKD